MSLSELRRRDADRGVVGRLERAQFFMVLRVSRGRGQHLLDFRPLPLRPGTVVIVRPGQVQQWHLSGQLDGDLVLVDPVALPPGALTTSRRSAHHLCISAWPDSFQLDAGAVSEWDALTRLLRRQFCRTDFDDLQIERIRQLFSCLLLTIAPSAQTFAAVRTREGELHHEFVRLVERFYALRPTVASLAERLNVSPVTLSRASRACSGRSAKSLIDQRIALEAKRLLAHSDATSAEISEKLGFSEPTNFLKFFKRQTALSPERFRLQVRPELVMG